MCPGDLCEVVYNFTLQSYAPLIVNYGLLGLVVILPILLTIKLVRECGFCDITGHYICFVLSLKRTKILQGIIVVMIILLVIADAYGVWFLMKNQMLTLENIAMLGVSGLFALQSLLGMFSDYWETDLLDIKSAKFSEIKVKIGWKIWRLFLNDCVKLNKHIEWLAFTTLDENFDMIVDKMIFQDLNFVQNIPKNNNFGANVQKNGYQLVN